MPSMVVPYISHEAPNSTVEFIFKPSKIVTREVVVFFSS